MHPSGLIDHFSRDKGEKGQARIENLDELVNAAREFEYEAEDEEELEPLPAFLTHAALEAGEPELIVTGNIGCHMHLSRRAKVPVRHWIEVISPDQE